MKITSWTFSHALFSPTFCAVLCGAFGNMNPCLVFNRFENDAYPCVQRLGNAPQHAERMAFIAGRLQAADLLLGGLKEFCQLFLGESCLLTKGGNLQRHIPCLAGMLKAGSKCRVMQLFFKIMVEVGLFHFCSLFCQSCIRSGAIARSRAGIANPLLRMPCTATMRRFLTKNQNTRVFSFPTWRSSNRPSPIALDKGSR